jgi:hypothetical protein
MADSPPRIKRDLASYWNMANEGSSSYSQLTHPFNATLCVSSSAQVAKTVASLITEHSLFAKKAPGFV